MKPQIVERALPDSTHLYFCTICDETIEDLGKDGVIMYYDENGLYHVPCWDRQDAKREAAKNQLTLWEDD